MLNRGQFAACVAAAACAIALLGETFAQSAKQVKVLVGYAPGGGADAPRAVIVHNKAGAAGRLAITSEGHSAASGRCVGRWSGC